ALDTTNVGVLAQKIDEISARKICRVILNFGPDANAPDPDIASWLRQVAVQSGRNPVLNDNFPTMPAAVVDFHMVNSGVPDSVPESETLNSAIRQLNLAERGQNPASRNLHDEVIAAIDSAVAPLCEMLTREELLRAIRHGDDATKAAVLRHGAERLTGTNLPQVISLTDDPDLNVATAAIFALRTSGDAKAVQKLVTIAVTKEPSTATTDQAQSEVRRAVAVRSLAASKFSTAHPEVIRLLSTNDSFLIAETADAIVAHPRPVWSEPLAAQIAQSSEQAQPPLLAALAAVGHPRLMTILERCLTSPQPTLSSAALNILINRHEPAAEQLTSQWMLKTLETTTPSSQLLTFLRRTRDHRAIPLLLRHLEKKSADREELLTTILTIGDDRVAEQIAASFESFNFNEQLLILKTLADVRSEQFWTLTSSIVKRSIVSDDKLLDGVVTLLQQRSNDQAVSLLVDILKKVVTDENHSRRHLAVVCAALASTGTPEARDALRDVARNSGSAAATARQSLAQLYLRSPAQRYVQQGGSYIGLAMRLAEQDDNGEAAKQIALAMLYLDAAVQTDSELPDARRWRANAALHIDRPSAEQLETARADFARYIELEPDESEGHTGLALVLVRQGKIEAGIAAGMAISEKSAGDSVYFYNMACIYGRAIEQLESRPDLEQPERKSLIEQYRTQGIAQLQKSIDNGLDDSNLGWMKRDPDLKTIRQSPEFAILVEKALGHSKVDRNPNNQK
ncbi:MAG: HEAT repeat domain-containing protein, partial [Rhodopirellula sp.]|nr:HEAT repeat domain-containing protein [Rhodopirellula sp.]